MNNSLLIKCPLKPLPLQINVITIWNYDRNILVCHSVYHYYVYVLSTLVNLYTFNWKLPAHLIFEHIGTEILFNSTIQSHNKPIRQCSRKENKDLTCQVTGRESNNTLRCFLIILDLVIPKKHARNGALYQLDKMEIISHKVAANGAS